MQVCYHDAAKAKHVRSVSPIFSFAVAPSDVCNFIAIQDVSNADPATWLFTLVVVKAGFPDMTLGDAGRLGIIKGQCVELAEPVRINSFIPLLTDVVPCPSNNSQWRSSILWIPDDTKVSQNRLGSMG